jgi:hypothetical protein
VAGRTCLIAVSLLTAALTPVSLAAQPVSGPPRAAILATVGAMHPLEAGVRELYRGTFVPVTVEADFRVAWQVFVFGSGQFLRKDGDVIFDVPPAAEEHFPLRLSTASVRVGGGITLPWREWLFTAAGGLSYTRYSERWTAEEEIPTATGRIPGFIVGGGVDYRILTRLWAVGRVEYAYAPMDETRQTIPAFDLSGVSVAGGVGIRF